MANYLIIGGSSGIGKALAEQLAKEGHQVFAIYNQHPLSDYKTPDFYQSIPPILPPSTFTAAPLVATAKGLTK